MALRIVVGGRDRGQHGDEPPLGLHRGRRNGDLCRRRQGRILAQDPALELLQLR